MPVLMLHTILLTGNPSNPSNPTKATLSGEPTMGIGKDSKTIYIINDSYNLGTIPFNPDQIIDMDVGVD
jgi:hypothetical protein